MKFESLANELLLELFEFLDAVHLFRAFSTLNARFDTLLFVHFRHFQLDFRSLSKRDFDLVCQQYLPLSVDRVTSLCISDDHETPNLLDYFIDYGFTLDQFIHLRSLSFLHIDLIKINAILTEPIYPIQLTHLKLTQCYYRDEDDVVCLINNIWHLPKLTHCYLDFIQPCSRLFMRLKVISSSIEFISSPCLRCPSKDLYNLFEHTPRLRYLDEVLYIVINGEPLKNVVRTMRSLHIVVLNISQSTVINLCQYMPNLSKLTVQVFKSYLNGHQWKEIIVYHLPNIKTFRFAMNFQLSNDTDTEKRLDELLDTFRTSFWLDEHYWYVQCHWNPQDVGQNTHIYTLPHTLPYCFDASTKPKLNGWCKLTCPNDRDFWSYDYVRKSPLTHKIDDWSLLPMRFPKLDSLGIDLPINESIWSIIPTLNHLTSLTVYMNGNSAESELQALLDRAPRLYSLTVRNNSGLQFIQWKIRSTSILRLDLMPWKMKNQSYFTTASCFALINSPLGRQCEVLSIQVEDRSNIIDLINRMLNLRALTVCSKDDEWNDFELSSVQDEFLEWLRAHLPFTCSIRRHISQIEIWISKETGNAPTE